MSLPGRAAPFDEGGEALTRAAQAVEQAIRETLPRLIVEGRDGRREPAPQA